MPRTIGSILTLLFLLSPIQISAQRDLTRYVDPFIGTAGAGHTFPGPTLPFGMVQLSPDTRLSGWEGCSGYHYSDDVIYGFSHTHLSGTGIPDYADILLMPTVGEVSLGAMNAGDPRKGYASRFQHRNEIARPGYYSVRLDDDNVFVELTTTRRVGLHRYTYPPTKHANIILDLTHRDKVLDSGVRITGAKTIEGWRRSSSWAKDQIVFFAAEFSQPFTKGAIERDDQMLGIREARGTNVKAFFTFDASSGAPVMVKVGISSVSIEGARRNLAAELSHWNFDNVSRDAQRAWNAELRKIEVRGGTDEQLKIFYTALYHAMIAPNLFQDVDGQYRGRDLKIHRAETFDNYTVFSLWDTFRAAHPLFTIIDQKRTRDFLQTFLAQYEQGGRLPVWELAANETDTMIGYHAVSVIADAAAKEISGFDREKALSAMKHSASLTHLGLDPYIQNGFIGLEDEKESVSKTLEYAYDDWCVAEMARLMGRPDDYQRFIARAQSYKNIFDAETGFMRPRSNGGWLTRFDPREVDFNFTEANSWQYSFFVPHDVSGLIELMGGKRAFVRKLDEMFATESRTTGRVQADITGLMGQYAHGNEPSHHVAYLYNYANQPWKTQARVRQIVDQFYTAKPDGLIGNEDCGQMSAWYVLSAAGFYPVTPGSPVYVIGTPLFPELRFNLENGKTFVIKARGVSGKNFYIKSATLNGEVYSKSFLMHRDLMAGGELVFEMGPQPNENWGSRDKDVPISRIVEEAITPVPVIQTAGRSFQDRLEVSMNGPSGSSIHYTTDGSQPGIGSPRFTKSFLIDRSTTIKAVAINPDGKKSRILTSNYLKLSHRWTLKLLSTYSTQYSGGGDLAVIDGLRGTTNWSGGGWQGYWGKDFVAVVDLGKTETISKIGAGFLQDIGSWIFMPSRVDFEVSLDGHNFELVSSIPNEVSDKKAGVLIQDFVRSIPPQKARYVRVRAQNYGKLPSWHPGSGRDSWIFVDEIIVE